jgi:hypothetical protein
MTAAQAREWLEVYPELGKIATTTSEGIIEMNAEEVDAFIEGKDAELDSSIDTQIAELESEKAALEQELEMRKTDLEMAQTISTGKLKLEGASAEYLANMRTNLTEYFMELGASEV